MMLSFKLDHNDRLPFDKLQIKNKALISGVLTLLGIESMLMPDGMFPVEHLSDFAKRAGLKRNHLDRVLDYLKKKLILREVTTCNSTRSVQYLSIPYFKEQWDVQKKNTEFRKEVSGPLGAEVRKIPDTLRSFYKKNPTIYGQVYGILEKFREMFHPGVKYEGLVPDMIFISIFNSLQSILGESAAYTTEDYYLAIEYMSTKDRKFVTLNAFRDDKFPVWLGQARQWKEDNKNNSEIQLVGRQESKEEIIQQLRKQLESLPNLGISDRQEDALREQIKNRLDSLGESNE